MADSLYISAVTKDKYRAAYRVLERNDQDLGYTEVM